MTQNFRKGDYIKAIGADWGIFFDGSRWISFQCLGCAIAKGLVVPSQRLLNGDHPRLAKKIGKNYIEKHDNDLHARWFRAGKPTGGLK